MPFGKLSSHFVQQPLAERLAEQFADLVHYGETLAILSVAVALAAILACHPSTRQKTTTRAGLEQPKTMVLYGLVGALVGHIVRLDDAMALVVFGIGGLLRFRTVVGEANDTGRVILSAIVGVCVGLQSFLVAVLATAFGWVIIWQLERQIVGRVEVFGLDLAQMEAASAAYRQLLEAAHCRIVGEMRSPKNASIELVFKAPAGVRAAELRLASGALEAPQRGQPFWELT